MFINPYSRVPSSKAYPLFASQASARRETELLQYLFDARDSVDALLKVNTYLSGVARRKQFLGQGRDANVYMGPRGVDYTCLKLARESPLASVLNVPREACIQMHPLKPADEFGVPLVTLSPHSLFSNLASPQDKRIETLQILRRLPGPSAWAAYIKPFHSLFYAPVLSDLKRCDYIPQIVAPLIAKRAQHLSSIGDVEYSRYEKLYVRTMEAIAQTPQDAFNQAARSIRRARGNQFYLDFNHPGNIVLMPEKRFGFVDIPKQGNKHYKWRSSMRDFAIGITKSHLFCLDQTITTPALRVRMNLAHRVIQEKAKKASRQ